MRLNTKRTGQLSPFEGWATYYAGYPLKFALRVLQEFTDPGDRILDPWNGSGTTTAAASYLGRCSTGIDLNPFAVLLAQARMYRDEAVQFRERVERALRDISSATGLESDDPVGEWLTNSGMVRSFQGHLERELCSGAQVADQASRAFARLFTIQCARRAVSLQVGSNPTWVKRPNAPYTLTFGGWRAAIAEQTGIAAAVLDSMPALSVGASLHLADARSLPLPDSSVDFVLTSPPYCTRIDYAISSSFELAFLGYSRDSERFDGLRRSLMGTTCIRDSSSSVVLPGEIVALLKRIRDHGSYESAGYYLKNYRQYFLDFGQAIRELARVLRSSGRVVMVVQDSFFKDVHVDLPTLIGHMAEGLGLVSDVLATVPVNRSLVDINSRARQNVRRRKYHETVLVLKNTR